MLNTSTNQKIDNIKDRAYRKDFGVKTTDIVSISSIEKYNKEKAWKYGYNSKYNIVVISKDGTIGDIWDVDGLYIATPKPPKLDEFENASDNEIFQIWKRKEVPYELSNFTSLFKPEEREVIEEKYEEFINEDLKRIEYGYWFLNDGERTYLTGGHYFFLQHYKHYDTNKFGDFRRTQMFIFYYIAACYADSRSLGFLLLKNRGVAFSSIGASEVLRLTCTRTNVFAPLVSKTENDAEKLFQQKISFPLRQLPIYITPINSSKDKAVKNRIDFTDPKSKFGNESAIEKYPCTVDAYDGTRPKISLNDELFKYKKFSVNTYWDTHKDCHTTGLFSITGKALCGSTAGEFENGGGKAGKLLFERSDISKRNGQGQTDSGLYALFIPAEYGQTGYHDKWGYLIYDNPSTPIENEEGALIKIGVCKGLDIIEENLTGISLNNHRRNHPRTIIDAFRETEGSYIFDIDKIEEHLTFLRRIEQTDEYKAKVFRFDLDWVDGIQDNPKGVKMVRTKNGRFVASWLPPENIRNIFAKDSYGKKRPVNSWLGVIGCDPYGTTRVTYSRKSSGTAVFKTAENLPADFPSSSLPIYYENRPPTVDMFFDDMIKLTLFLSVPIFPERNISRLKDVMVDRGYSNYILKRPDVKKIDLKEGDKDGGLNSNNTTYETLLQPALISYILRYIGTDLEIDKCKCLHPLIIEDWLAYDWEKRTKYDLTIASMYACFGSSKIQAKIDEKQKTDKELDVTKYFHSAI